MTVPSRRKAGLDASSSMVRSSRMPSSAVTSPAGVVTGTISAAEPRRPRRGRPLMAAQRELVLALPVTS